MRLTKRGSVGGWGGGESNHKHIDPNNTDNLVNTAETIVPHRCHPAFLLIHTNTTSCKPKIRHRNGFVKLLDVCRFLLTSSCTEWWNSGTKTETPEETSQPQFFIKGWPNSAAWSSDTKLQLAGEKMQVSNQGRDGTGGMTTQDNLPQSKNCTVASGETTPNNSDRHLKAHSPENHALRLVLSS